MAEKACQEYFEKFPSSVRNHEILNEDRIKFMVTNPVIRNKLEEWLVTGNSSSSDNADLSAAAAATTCPSSFSTNKANTNFAALPKSTNSNSGEYLFKKNFKRSLDKRKEGNLYFQKGKWEQSLICYHEALRHSKFTSEEKKEAAICLANRSAVYYEMGKYDFSLRDAEMALANRYPENLHIKLHIRKANIYLKQKNFKMATKMVQLGREGVMENENEEAADLKANEKLNKIENEIRMSKNLYNKDEEVDSKFSEELKAVKLIDNQHFEENILFENASSALTIQFSEKAGRSVNSDHDLSISDVLFQEEPFASVLIPEFYADFCNYCHVELKGYFFPCSNCTQVSYCNAVCSTKAWKQYHVYECQSLQLLQSVGIAHLALRVLLIAGTEEVLETIKLEKELNNTENFKAFRKGEPNYSRVYSLMDHIDDMKSEDLFQYCLTASLLTLFLKMKTRFLGGLRDEEIDKIGGAILRHICQLICNGHAVTSILSDLNLEQISYSTLEETQVKIASAIYPAVSLINHSCDPNIACSFKDGRSLIVKAATNLQKGSEILNCYGPSFRRMSRKTRQENLKEQYFFDCICDPCQRELEEKSNFVDKFQAYNCAQCKGPVLPDRTNQTFLAECTKCHHVQDVKENVQNVFKSDEFYSEGLDQLKEGRVREAIENLQKCHYLRTKTLFECNMDIGEVCDALGRCYAIIGDFQTSVSYVQQSLGHVEARFGISSIEYAREIIKYSELLDKFEKNNFDGFPSDDLIKKSKFIMELYTPL